MSIQVEGFSETGSFGQVHRLVPCAGSVTILVQCSHGQVLVESRVPVGPDSSQRDRGAAGGRRTEFPAVLCVPGLSYNLLQQEKGSGNDHLAGIYRTTTRTGGDRKKDVPLETHLCRPGILGHPAQGWGTTLASREPAFP